MARVRGDSADGGTEREARQQKLPLSWRGETATAASRPAVAGEAVADEVVPGEAVAGQAVAGQAVAGQAVAGQAVAGEAVAGEAVAGEAVAGEAVAGEAVAEVPGDEEPAERGEGATAALPAPPAPPAAEPASVLTGPVSDGVGDLLLSARADSGFSIEEASARTRIPRDIIEHLECNACGQLPSEYYCSAHIEKLSALYNVDPKPILERLHADMLAQRGAADGLGHFRAVTTDSESGSRISYVLPGPGSVPPKRSVSLTSTVVSGVIALFLLIFVAALAAQHFRHREDDTPAGAAPAQVGHAPPVDLKEFIVTEELNAYELPIPAK